MSMDSPAGSRVPHCTADCTTQGLLLGVMYGMQANTTMRRTLRPTKPSVSTTGNKMLDIAIRMAGTLEQQEKEAAEALLAP